MYVSAVIEELLGKYRLKPFDASKRTGIDPSQFSRWLDDKPMGDDHFKTLCTVLFKDPQDQARLLRARLQDSMQGQKGADLLDIQILTKRPSSDNLKEFPPAYRLSAASRQDLARVATAMEGNRRLRDIIHGLATYGEQEER